MSEKSFQVCGGISQDGELFIDLHMPGGGMIRLSEAAAQAINRSMTYILENAHAIPGYVPTERKPFVYEAMRGVILGDT